MSQHLEQIRRVIRSARRRWFYHTLFRSGARAGLALAFVSAAAWLAARLVLSSTTAHLAGLAAAWLLASAAAFAWAVWPLRRRPNDARVARFVEEHCPQLEDRLATAVEFASQPYPGQSPVLAELLYRDAADRAVRLDLETTISRHQLVRRGSLALGATLMLVAAVVLVWPLARDAGRAFYALAFPAGRVAPPRALAGKTTVHVPRVIRIDVRYQYPARLHLDPREELDGGDIYAPPGTHVTLTVHTDTKARGGDLVTSAGARYPLESRKDDLFEAALSVNEDGAYRVALADPDGRTVPGDTEYFIRVLADAPPDVRITEPASDRQVTPLEEVKIAAHADDDQGVRTFDLVYSVGGGPERSAPFETRGSRQSLDGTHLLYLEELQVRPGDFVTYYARARDASGGSEARSDMFFLQVTPFGQEFLPPETQASQGAGTGAASTSLDDLVRAQKEIVLATWKLDRRARKSRTTGSQDDVRTVARAQGELRKRAIDAAGPAFASAARTEKKGAGTEAPGDGADAMANAIDAMARAEQSLDAVDTGQALPHEMRALNELMKAQASQRQWQMRQAAGAGAGNDNANTNQDLSSLFDTELKRQQRTNYESLPGSEQPQRKQDDALDRVRQLAERQDGLAQRQRELERQRAQMTPDEFKRELERLTREQSDLRQQAEELAQRLRSASGQSRSAASGKGASKGTSVGEASDAMRQAANSLRDGKVGDAARQSAQAIDRLRSAEQQVRGEGRAAGAPTLGDLQMQAQQAADAERRVAEQAAAGTGKNAADAMRRLAGEKERIAESVERLQQALKQASAASELEARQRDAIGAVGRDLEHLQLPRQMRESASALRDPAKADVNRPESAAKEADLAKTLGRLADRIAAVAGNQAARQAERLEQARSTRDRLAQLEQQMKDLERRQATDAGNPKGAPQAGRGGQAQGKAVGTSGEGAANATDLQRLREQYKRELQRAADQLNQWGRQAGIGFTPEGQEAIFSAPGFHQDFSKWEQLARGVNDGLERAETTLSKKLRDEQAHDHLRSPSSERVPEQYRRLVEQYYQALSAPKAKGGK